ncbi:MAG: aminoglycoside phosphotransferase family protein [Acidobacteria bacterium]|nr:aminoglycoside phosphotransferase family protein [Acidobacteriota bacterium]MBU4307685.1 aminoglycoside phosphotransferase family protein [Acidobacteriota bacterium]MBU4405273.1 aminoglycoside phosphotransferase family protein [Acidobacteriota bacterium]MCG2811194.1 aminoglycoside phosphotransferase family protein [Candidatus Aminicenantes bacterium]
MLEKKISGPSSIDGEFAGLFSKFALEGTFAAAQPYGSGHIHETYLLHTRGHASPDYILQRINTNVFTDVPRLMENIVRVTGHLRRKIAAIPGADPDREVLRVVPSSDNRYFHQDGDGNYWRCYVFIDHQRPGDRVESPGQAFEAGKLFGRFINLLSDLPGPPLHETIPAFHNVEHHLDQFKEVLQADPLLRRNEAAKEIIFVQERAEEMKRILVLGREGRIPLRVTHNDTKFNNILFDGKGRARCLVDLDTVMPGYVHYDFGDAIRSGCNRAREDEPDLERVGMDIHLFAGYARGFLESLPGCLSTVEISHLAFSAKLFAYMVGLRFLSDYLVGDLYFKTVRSGHNLQRARVHFQLLLDMERRGAEMEDIVSGLALETTS